MSLLVGVAIRSSVMLAAGLILNAALARRAAALRHRVLAGTLLAAAVVTPLSLVGPEWVVTLERRPTDVTASPAGADPLTAAPQRRAHDVRTPDSSRPARSPDQASTGWTALLTVAWLSGSVLCLATLIHGVFRIGRVASRGSPVTDPEWLQVYRSLSRRYGLRREVAILRTDSAGLLGTWGTRRPEVLVPPDSQDWTLERVHVVLGHELAHIRRHDWLVQMGGEVIRAILWFNPLVWLVYRRLRQSGEQACDDEVLGTGVEARVYGAHLVELARQCRRPGPTWALAMPMAHPSTLEARITAMLNPRLDRRAPSGRAIAAISAALLSVTLPVAALRAGQAGPIPVTGTVYDGTGAVMPGVNVTLVDATEARWTATSTANGRFELPAVGPGKFVLEASVPGFRALRHEVELRDPRDWDRSITLQIGTLTETIHISASRAALPKHLPSSPADSQRIRVGGNVRVPRKEVHVAPAYPPAMRAAGLAGVVPVEAIIGADGSVSSVRVLSAQVHPDFAIAAVDAVRQWRFTPTLLNGVPVEVAMTVTLRFDLAD